MSKGEETRHTILEHATARASELGLEGLSIGKLADELGLSKSGLFAHFQSKEALQIQVLETARQHFVEVVIRPALEKPRGEKRLCELVERWLVWPERARMRGGCFFAAAAMELDDRPGPVRDHLAALQREWLSTIARVAGTAAETGELRRDLDAEQVAFELYGHMLAYNHATRLLRDAKAKGRARKAFEALLEANRPPKR